MNDKKEFILDLLRRASAVSQGAFGRVTGTSKPHDRAQVVTQTDVEIAGVVARAIDATYPDHNRIDEELGVMDRGSKYTWVIDPIDGTSNFAVGIPMYGIMIALLHEDRPVAGGIALPAFDAFYWATKGGGAWCGERRLRLGECILADALVAYGIDGYADDVERTRDECLDLGDIASAVRNVRSSNSVYDAVMLAEGKYMAWMVRTSRIWDNVAPHLLIEEAGGRFTRFDGSPVVYNDAISRFSENFTICAAPPRVHEELQTIIGAGRPRRGLSH
jgi:myo-inositol-1(or 4)-monophosphatase